MSGISVVMMLIALDQTIVGTALPRMVAELQGFDLYPWVAASYLLTTAIFIPLTGRLGDLYGRKPFLLSAIIIFLASSVLCGQADSMMALVLARGLQGIGGGMLIGCAFASVSDLFPFPFDRIKWQVMLSASFGIASAVGPGLGGWITEQWGWRNVFYVNAPIGLVALALVWRFLPWVVHNEQTRKSMDWLGVVWMILAISSLLGCTEFGEQLGLTSASFVILVLFSVACIYGFFRHQIKTDAPVIPARLLNDPVVRRLMLLALVTGLIMFVLIYYAPLLLQGGFSMSPNEAGIIITPIIALVTVGSILNGRLLTRIKKPELLFSYGGIALILSLLGLCLINRHTPNWMMMSLFAISGLSLGFQLPNLVVQIQAAVSPADQGAASALIQTLRTIGSMLGASLAGVMVSLGFKQGLAPTISKISNEQGTILDLLASPQVLLRTEDQEMLYKLSSTHGFDANLLMEQARLGLVSGIHQAFFMCLILALIGYVISLKLPNFLNKNN